MKTKPKTKPPSKIQWFNGKDPEHIHPVEALKYIERRLRGSLSYQIAMDKEARIALGSWIKMVVRAQNKKAFQLYHHLVDEAPPDKPLPYPDIDDD